MTDTVEFWAGEFGEEYTRRNRVDWRARILFWDRLIQKTGVRSVYEVGCNAGWNLSAIRAVDQNIALAGNEINLKAQSQALACDFDVHTQPIQEMYFDEEFELVFTSGVLIHLDLESLQETVAAIVSASCDYVLAIEYESDVEEEVEYRGHTGKLWKRPYGKMYEACGLTLIETGKLDAKDGFDPNGVTYWLMRK